MVSADAADSTHFQTTSHISAELDESGMYGKVDLEVGEATCTIALSQAENLRVDRLYVRHPMVTAGFIQRGNLFTLVSSPAGPWDRVAAGALAAGAKASPGDAVPKKYGLVLGPLLGKLACFSFFEPESSLGGVYLNIDRQRCSFVFLASASQPAPQRDADQWLLERRAASARTLGHCLFRLCANHGPVAATVGTVVSATRYTSPAAAGSVACTVAPGYLELSATLSGSMRDYIGLDGRPGAVPWTGSWMLAADKPLPFDALVEYSLEIETLPLLHIPFRKTKESVNIEFGIKSSWLEGEAGTELAIKTERSGLQELTWKGDLVVSVTFPYGSVGFAGELSGGTSEGCGWGVQKWRIGLPVKVNTGIVSCSLDASLHQDDSRIFGLSVELSGTGAADPRWYVSAGVKLPIAMLGEIASGMRPWGQTTRGDAPPQPVSASGGSSPSAAVPQISVPDNSAQIPEFLYTIGWRI